MHDKHHSFLKLASVLSLSLLIAGCATSTMRIGGEYALHLESDDGITLIMSDYGGVSPEKLQALSRDIETCVTETIRENTPSLRIVMVDEFRRVAFPGLDFNEIPRDQEHMLSLLRDFKFQERIAPLKLKYFIMVTGKTSGLTNQSGGIYCGAGYGGAGCLGLTVWDKIASLQASIIDGKQASQVGELEVDVTGKPWLAVIGFIPVGLPAFPEQRVCVELGHAISKTIAIGEVPEHMDGNQSTDSSKRSMILVQEDD
jgi:hypothetical protein